nr:hypothetical protein CFP56_45906 [Quercus suber]
MTEKVRQIPGGFGNKGKEAALDFQNLKSCISWGGISGTDKHQVGAEVTSVTSAFNEAENPRANTTLSLDISLHVERGNDGKWVVISTDIKEVGQVAVKPIEEVKTHSFKTVLLNGSGPRPLAAWKPKAHSFKALGYKARSHSKHILDETQRSVLVSSGSLTQVLEVTPSQPCVLPQTSVLVSSDTATQVLEVTPSQPCFSSCHEEGLGPSPLAGKSASEAISSFSVSYQVLPGSGSGSLEPLPLLLALNMGLLSLGSLLFSRHHPLLGWVLVIR